MKSMPFVIRGVVSSEGLIYHSELNRFARLHVGVDSQH